MVNHIGISFWITTFLICLQARYLPQEDACISCMKSYITCPQDSKFYAPTNVEAECIPAAMDCVMRELNGTVTPECDDPEEYVLQALDFFKLKIEEKGTATTTSAECECEMWPETSFSEFLDKVESLLQLDESVQQDA